MKIYVIRLAIGLNYEDVNFNAAPVDLFDVY